MLSLLAALLHATPQEAPPRTSLARLAREGAPIALVRVDKVHEIQHFRSGLDRQAWPEDPIRVAEVVVQSRLLASPEEERFFVALGGPGSDASSEDIVAGERLVVFVDQDRRFPRLSQLTTKRLDLLVGSRWLGLPLPGGVWRVVQREGAAWAQVPGVLDELPEALAKRVVEHAVPLTALLEWLDKELDRVTPSAGARLVSTGAKSWSVEIEADGTYHGTTEGHLDAAQLAALWKRIEDERFAELPGSVTGSRRGPDDSSYVMWIRRRDGYRRVAFWAWSLDADDGPAVKDQMARALRVLDAFPGDKGSLHRD